nr:putative tubulin--tyrosine ligase c12b10.04 [Quercus suber]
MTADPIFACIEYQDDYVQPLILAAIKARLPPELLVFISNVAELPNSARSLLQWRQYENIDFDHLVGHPGSSLANSYIIRKALIRKHYLSNTISHWVTKNPVSILASHVKPSVEFEVDYAEFLDDALVEAFELHDSWSRNMHKDPSDREWWILKPGMSERAQGIRLFSTEEELTEIFEAWDPLSDAESDEIASQRSYNSEDLPTARPCLEDHQKDDGVVTSQLRHFIAQPYIARPLLLAKPHPSADRKFHIRAYVLAVGALKLYVYKPMLGLFANEPYILPGASSPNDNLKSHLTNTCLQTGAREGSVHAFWSLPSVHPKLGGNWQENVFTQICDITAETFEAAARSMSVHFQVLPNAFEVFGLDFLVDDKGSAWLLEVNAFPDFRQSGDELRGLIEGLVEGAIDKGIIEFFGLGEDQKRSQDVKNQYSSEAMPADEAMVRVLELDLGRR